MRAKTATTPCARRWSRKCATTSARSRRPRRSTSPPRCPRPARARSCAASCAKSRRARRQGSATPRLSPTPAWSKLSLRGGSKRRLARARREQCLELAQLCGRNVGDCGKAKTVAAPFHDCEPVLLEGAAGGVGRGPDEQVHRV